MSIDASLGRKKILYMLQEQIVKNEVQMGRDRFFHWLRAQELLVRPKRRYINQYEISIDFGYIA